MTYYSMWFTKKNKLKINVKLENKFDNLHKKFWTIKKNIFFNFVWTVHLIVFFFKKNVTCYYQVYSRQIYPIKFGLFMVNK